MGALSKKLRSVEGGRVMFWCPGCDGAHQITVEDAPNRQGPIWGYNNNPDAPTFTPSVLVRSGHCADGTPAGDCFICKNANTRGVKSLCGICHSFVTDGRIQFLGDCTHHLAGQTVEIPDWEDA